MRHLISIVLRFPDVAISRNAMDALFGMPLDRFGPSRVGPLWYAQINVPEDGDPWSNIVTIVDRIGSASLAMVSRGEIGQPRADVGIAFPDELMSASIVVPCEVAGCLGRHGFDIEVSAYLTGSD